MKIGPVSLLGVGTGYRATLMSGGSHRLWNQLLHATLFRSASLFPWRTRRLAFQSRVEFSPLPFLQNPVGHQNLSLSPSLPLFLSLLSVLVGKKKRLIIQEEIAHIIQEEKESRRIDSTKGQTSPG